MFGNLSVFDNVLIGVYVWLCVVWLGWLVFGVVVEVLCVFVWFVLVWCEEVELCEEVCVIVVGFGEWFMLCIDYLVYSLLYVNWWCVEIGCVFVLYLCLLLFDELIVGMNEMEMVEMLLLI